MKYLAMKGPLDTRRGYHASPIDPYMSDLKQANKQGMTVKQMDLLLRQKGYTGKYSTLINQGHLVRGALEE